MPKRLKAQPKPLHPRLEKLNHDMAVTRSRDICDVTAVRGDFKFRVTVHRHPTYGFIATTKAAGRLMSYAGRVPSDAFQTLTQALTPTIRRYEAEQAEAEFRATQAA